MMRKPVFSETFASPFEAETRERAEHTLNQIRESHREEYGWIEDPAKTGVTQLPNGKWRAYRTHTLYR